MRLMKLGVMWAALVGAPWELAQASIITVVNTNTDDIVVPKFNQSLGTLTSVNLNVTLLPGSTSLGGADDPPTYQIFSTNTRNNTNVSGFSGSVTSSTNAADSFTVTTPTYSGGGLTIGPFIFSTNSGGSHTHTVSYTFAGPQLIGPSIFRAVATLDPQAYSGYSTNFFGSSQNLTYTGSGLTPFLGVSDIVIGAGTISTPTASGQILSVPGFSPTVNSSSGPWTWFFTGSSFNDPSYSLNLNPRFTTTTTFTYNEVQSTPEPASLALCGMGALGLMFPGLRRRWQRRNLNRA